MRPNQTRRRPRNANALVLFFCVALVAAAPEQAYCQVPEFDAVAARLSGAIVLVSRGLLVKPSAVVTDFVETHGGSNAMGAGLARELSKALAKYARDFVVADPGGEFDAPSANGLPSQSSADAAVNCSTGKPKPTFVVEGHMDGLQDRVVVRIEATRIEDKKTIFDERVTVPRTAAMQAL
jgi:TolB-like protein